MKELKALEDLLSEEPSVTQVNGRQGPFCAYCHGHLQVIGHRSECKWIEIQGALAILKSKLMTIRPPPHFWAPSPDDVQAIENARTVVGAVGLTTGSPSLGKLTEYLDYLTERLRPMAESNG